MLIPLLARLSNVFYIAGHDALPFFACSCLSYPCWFWIALQFHLAIIMEVFQLTNSGSWRPLDNSMGLPVVCKLCNVLSSAKLLLLVFCDHIFHSIQFLNYFTLDVLKQRYTWYGSFHSPLCHNLSLFFLLCGNAKLHM